MKLRERIEQRGRPVVAVALQYPVLGYVEVLGRLGFDVLWIEMEHGHISFAEAAHLCQAAHGADMLAMIRIPDALRQTVLRAAECGPDILDLPMVNYADTAREFVKHARFAPIGKRGYYGSSRAMLYGLYEDIAARREAVNEDLCLMVQIETAEAVENIGEICQVDGIDAIFIGRGDLSADLGIPGQIDHPDVEGLVDRVIEAARKAGKIVGVPSRPERAREWAARGADFVVCGGDASFFVKAARECIKTVRGE